MVAPRTTGRSADPATEMTYRPVVSSAPARAECACTNPVGRKANLSAVKQTCERLSKQGFFRRSKTAKEEGRGSSVMRAKDKKRRKTLRAAHRAPDWVRFVAASKAGSLADQHRHRNAKWGKSFGAASPVRQIVRDGKPVEPGEADDPRFDERAPWE